jgi:molybdopterin-guanine dinucleotide biosynthesis protein A
MDLSAIILAGGESKRMGQDKAAMQFNGDSLLARAIKKVRQLGIKEIFISGRIGMEYSTFDYPVLFDLNPGHGPLGGIERGLHASSCALMLVLAVDLPHMDTAFLRQLILQCDAATGIVPNFDGRLEPLAAIYPKRCHAIASDLMARSRLAAREFAEKCLAESAIRTMPVAPSDARCFANWNTPADVTSGRD